MPVSVVSVSKIVVSLFMVGEAQIRFWGRPGPLAPPPQLPPLHAFDTFCVEKVSLIPE